MRFYFFLFVSFLCLSQKAQSQDYLWPTNSGNYLSSTFGETRSSHFHAGLDIKTWGREGYHVFASRDGILYRLLVTERGYGNAIYLKHADGTFTVYAHLQRFNAPFQSIADSIRMKDYSFEMDALLDTMNINVQQGDVIGYTGSTGIGPPHLHFEVRDSLEQPVNALTTNLSIKDEIAPVFSSLIVEPLTKESRIIGRPVSYYKRVKKTDNGIFDFGEVNVSGKAGLAVNVYDQANEVFNAYAVYSLALVHESDTIFYQELNSFNYDETSEMVRDRIAPFGSDRRGHQRLYEKENSTIPFYLITEEKSKITPRDSAQTYTIIASDYFGNTSEAKVTIIKDPKNYNGNPSLNTPPSKWYWHYDWTSPDLIHTLNLRRNDLGYPWHNNQQILWNDSSLQVNLARIIPGETQKIKTPDSRLSLRFNEQAFFDTLSIAAGYKVRDNEIHISVQPEMLPAKSDYQLSFFMSDVFEEGNNYRLFKKDKRDGSLNYVDSKLIGRTVHAFPSELGEFVIRADNAAPEISYFQVYQTDYGKWLASVQVKDEESGIESASASFIINDVRGIAEYDFEEQLLIYYLPGFVPASTHTATIQIKDKAGNQATAEFSN